MITIKVLTGSVRPGRFNIQPATWVYEQAKKRNDLQVELIDLQELNLPFLDEAASAKMQKYENEHTKKWSKVVEKTDGFIFVTPEYNHSFSPVLKNALDYLYFEWGHKPVSFVSYGALAGGARAVEHLRGVAGELKMYDLREQLLLPNYWDNLNQEGKYQFNEKHEHMMNLILDELTFWATKLKSAREELKSK